jgi:Holliday junction resolvase
MRRAAKIDATQDAIVSALRAAGASVQSLATVGNGCPDLLCAIRGQNVLFECKTGNKEPNELQKRWHIEWRAPVYVVRSPDDALRAIGAIA